MDLVIGDEPKFRKLPYFSLRSSNLYSKPLHALLRLKHQAHARLVSYKTLKVAFSEVSRMSGGNQARFMLAVLKNGSFEPKWQATARDMASGTAPMCKLQYDFSLAFPWLL